MIQKKKKKILFALPFHFTTYLNFSPSFYCFCFRLVVGFGFLIQNPKFKYKVRNQPISFRYSILLDLTLKFPKNCNHWILRLIGVDSFPLKEGETESENLSMNIVDPSVALLAASGGDTVKLFDVSVKSGDPCVSSYIPSPGCHVNSVKWNHTS